MSRVQTLSILVPVYNEEKTIETVLDRLKKLTLPNGINKEIVIIDDGSTDSSWERISRAIKEKKLSAVKLLRHAHNQGKGKAIRTGIEEASGDYLIIQDADLEYDPQFIPQLVTVLMEGKAPVIYGTRLKRLPHFSLEERTARFFLHYVGNRMLSLLTSILYGQWITDMETGYKLFPKKSVSSMHLTSRGFEFEPEITAKLLKKGYKIYEEPISTIPRSYTEGKKLNTVTDGVKALWALIKYRFTQG